MHDHEFHFWWPFLWVGLFFVFYLVRSAMRHRERMHAIETVRRMAETGAPVPPELVAATVQPDRSRRACTPDRDMRSGVFLLALAAAIAIMAAVLSYNHMGPHGIHPLYGVAAFPAILGAARLLLWRFGHGRAEL